MDLKAIRRNDFDHFSIVEARWRDMDGLRHINHAAYLSYFETARIQYLVNLGLEINRWDVDVSTILGRMKIDYIQQSAFPNLYEIGNRVTRLGKKSFDVFSTVFEEANEIPIVTGTFTIIAFDYGTQKTIPIPDIIKNSFNPF